MAIDYARVSRAQQAMKVDKLDTLVCRLSENILYLTGYWPMNGFAFAIFPSEGKPVLIVQEAEQAAAEAGWAGQVHTFGWALVTDPDPFESIAGILTTVRDELGLRDARIGYEGSYEFVAPAHMAGETSVPSGVSLALLTRTFAGAELLDATGFLSQLRGIKSAQEIEALRLANEVAEFGLAAFAENVVPGKSEAEIAAAVEAAIYARGVGYKGVTTARGWAHVMTGPRTQNSYRMFLVSTPRVLQEGDLALLELGTLVDGFWSDLTRTRVAGTPDARQREVHQIVLEAQAAAVALMKPGVLEKEVDQAARQIIERAGYGSYFFHQTGHGVGLRYHEPIPSLHPACENELAVGMVSSCEPGIYIPNWGGIRIEDNIAITATGPEYLSNYDRALS